MSKFRLTTILRSVENYKLWGGIRIGPFSTLQKYKKKQLEKLEAARSAYLWLPLFIFGYLALLSLSRPYWALLDLTGLTGLY